MIQKATISGGQSGNTTAVLVSVLAAGAAGVAGAILIGRPSKQERAQAKVDEQVAQLKARAERSSAQITRALDSISLDNEGTSRRARKQAANLQKSSLKAVDEAVKAANSHVTDLEKRAKELKVREQAKGLASHGSDLLVSLSATLVDQVNTVLEEARSRSAATGTKASDTVDDVRTHAESRTRALARQAGSEAASVKEDANRVTQDVKARSIELAAVGSAFVNDALKKTPEILDKVGKAAEDVRQHTPEVRDSLAGIAGSLAERGSDLVAKAKDQAPELAAKAKDRTPELIDNLTTTISTKSGDLKEQARPLIQDAGAAVAGAADHLLASAKDAGTSLKPDLHSQADVLGEKVTAGTHAISQQSKQAATAAGRGAKETGALVMWSAAAGTVIYAALLDDNQRQRLKDSGQRVWAEMREVIADIRGYDEEFA